MTTRNGYDIVPGDRWLFVGPKRDFPEGPEEVEVEDIQRGEVKVRFVDGKLEGKREWHRPARLYAPIEHVDELRQAEEKSRRIRAHELSDVEKRAVWTVSDTWGDAEWVLSGEWYSESDPERVAELLAVPVTEVTGMSVGEPSEDEPGKWHLFGTHQRHLARRLCQRYPEIIHDHAALEAAKGFRWLSRRYGYDGNAYADLPDEDPMVEYFRQPYLLVCSWCHVEPDCDRLDVLQNQRNELHWLFDELVATIDKLGQYSPQARAAATRKLRAHYEFTDKVPIGRWPGLPPPPKPKKGEV